MNPLRSLLCLVSFAALFAASASAQAAKTYVASTGSDSSPCSRTAPCRTFQAAINAVGAGGQVVALDSAGFGSNVTISKSVSMSAAPGVFAGITVFAGDGITVNAGPNDAIALRGLAITSQGTKGAGVVVTGGGEIEIEGCEIDGFSFFNVELGIVGPHGSGVIFGNSGKLFIKDTIIKRNFLGIDISSGSGTALAHMDNVSIVHNQFGMRVQVATDGAIRNSTISGNASSAILVTTPPPGNFGFGPSARLDVDTCLITNNRTGLLVEGFTSAVSISNCTISHNTDNGFFVQFAQGTIVSRGNNTIIGNGGNTGSLVPFSGQ
jgi:hypothetical protein